MNETKNIRENGIAGNDYEKLLNDVVSRHSFLRLALKSAAVTYVAINAVGCISAAKSPVALKKLSDREYANISIIGEFYLRDVPLKGFDAGQALDRYLYGAPNPHPVESLVRELVSIPSSILAMLFINRSFIPLAQMSKTERGETFLKWRFSHDPFQRGIYTLMHSLCMTLIAGEAGYKEYMGINL